MKTVFYLLLLGSGPASAALPAEVSTALENAAVDGVSVAAAVLLALVGMYAFKLFRKAFIGGKFD